MNAVFASSAVTACASPFMLLCLGVATYRAKIVLKKMLSCFSKFLVVCAALRSS